jgi:NADPH:quinone reductase-like Zn-dependent oxidoreductase
MSSISENSIATSIPSDHHLAAILPSKGSSLPLTQRKTPTPGPNELLIKVHSIALNPIDHFQRDHGFAITSYPAIIGSDIAGTILSIGPSVPSDTSYKPGTRVAAFAPCFFMHGDPDYGALQTHVIVPAVNTVPIPDDLDFTSASLLLMAVITVWSGWYSIGLKRNTSLAVSDKKGMLVWGGASSIGSAALQVAKLMGFYVYTTASQKHHAYLQELGATKVFEYKDDDVVAQIVAAAKEDGVTIQIAYDAVGQLKACLEVLKEFKGEGIAKVASGVPLSSDSPTADGVEVRFVAAPLDERERTEHLRFVFGIWLKEKLENKEFVPSPKIRLIEGSLGSANKALDELKKGVSGLKLVLEV